MRPDCYFIRRQDCLYRHVEQLQKRMGKHYNITIRTNAGIERYESDSIENTLFELLIKHREKSEAILDIQVNRGSLEQHFMKIAKGGMIYESFFYTESHYSGN